MPSNASVFAFTRALRAAVLASAGVTALGVFDGVSRGTKTIDDEGINRGVGDGFPKVNRRTRAEGEKSSPSEAIARETRDELGKSSSGMEGPDEVVLKRLWRRGADGARSSRRATCSCTQSGVVCCESEDEEADIRPDRVLFQKTEQVEGCRLRHF